MWVKELEGTDQCNVKNVVTLLAGILNINYQHLLVKKSEENQYKINDSIMAIN